MNAAPVTRHLCYLSLDHGVDVTGTKGAAVHVRSICRALVALGHRLTLIASRCDGDPAALGRALGCTVEALPAARDYLKLRRSLRAVYGKGLRLPPELRQEVVNRQAQTALAERWEADPPDAVIERLSLMGVAGIRTARERGIPHLLEVNALLSEEARRHRGLWDVATARATENEVLAHAHRVFAVSDPLREAIVARGIDAAKVETLPNGFDDALFTPRTGDEARAALGVGDRFTVGMAGSMRGWHGVRTLLRAFEILAQAHPDAALVLIGAGEDSEAIEQFQRDHPHLAIVATGSVDHAQVPDLLSACDALAAPYEAHGGFYFSPMKVYEYMAMERPIVASRQGQIADLIRDGETGLLFPPGDAEALARHLARLHGDATLRRRLGQAARRAVEGRTWSANARRLMEALEEVAP